jgi:hypothetical protein
MALKEAEKTKMKFEEMKRKVETVHKVIETSERLRNLEDEYSNILLRSYEMREIAKEVLRERWEEERKIPRQTRA